MKPIGGFNPEFAARAAQAAAKSAVAKPDASAESQVANGVADFRAALKEAENAVTATAVSGADPHAMVTALANAEMALEAAVTVRDKVVEAYQELLRMPV
ncbi:MAG: flagellar hook-basal body complex protein FliE [Pseudomonadota bacterium]